MRLLIALTLLLAPIVSLSFAQAVKVADDTSAVTKSGGTAPAQSNVRPSESLPRQGSSSSWEYWTNVTIQPGGSINLDSRIDYSASDTVRVTVLSANGGDLRDLVVSAYWSVPGLRFFSPADVVTGDGSYYPDARAATFHTYGSEFRLRLTNNTTSPVTLAQVLVFARVI